MNIRDTLVELKILVCVIIIISCVYLFSNLKLLYLPYLEQAVASLIDNYEITGN